MLKEPALKKKERKKENGSINGILSIFVLDDDHL